MATRWFTEFRCGRTSTSDAERSGRPKEVITPEIVDKIHEIILDDRIVKVREVAEAVGISTERVHLILHEYLDMKKLSARWEFDDVQPQSERVFAPFRNRERNVDPSQHTRDQGIIETVSFFR
ncbi:histone-lysine N-methyltransferase SETMAR-like [Belonocnema kinseyi]|uniref:histone-lysine N-methyltransferase SETMAR-like n=1 Tax=Belonocnema kinseyi TaxID=2817044 RepID=UPI00143D122C|nr:histone-lysine N-methyltransferase SETMAR-like [Belonocnema kinseyi]